MRKFKKIILSVIIVASVLLGIGARELYQVFNYNVTEEELGVEEDFFDISKDIQIPVEDLSTDTPNIPSEEVSQEITVNEVKVNQEINYKNKEVKIEAKQQVASKDDVRLQNVEQEEPNELTVSIERSPKEEIELIRNKYYPVFKQLQLEAINRLDRLYASAKKEYIQKRKNANFSKKEFASKYISANKKLEDAVNKVFYRTLESMKKELKNKELPLDIVNEAEQTYKQMIKSKKAKMIDQYL